MRNFFAVVMISLSALTVASAQEQKPKAQQSDKWEIYAGYSFVRNYGDINTYSANENNDYNLYKPFNMNGGQVSAAYFPWAHIGIKAEYAYTRKQGTAYGSTDELETNSDQSFLLGPTFRWNLRSEKLNRVTLFAHQLFGSTHVATHFAENGVEVSCTDSETASDCSAFAATEVSGGGVDIRVSRHFSVRPAELDYWAHQVSANTFLNNNEDEGNLVNAAKWSANGLRYSAGFSYRF